MNKHFIDRVCKLCEKRIEQELEYDNKPFKLNGLKWTGGREKKGLYRKIWGIPKKSKINPLIRQEPKEEVKKIPCTLNAPNFLWSL